MPSNILVIRLSSIGDLVLATPVFELLKRRFPAARIQLLVKPQFAGVLTAHPAIDQIQVLGHTLAETVRRLREERFSHVIDLHANWRSLYIRQGLALPTVVWNKESIGKLRLVWLKDRKLRLSHVVERYCATLATLGIQEPPPALSYPLPPAAIEYAQRVTGQHLAVFGQGHAIGLVLGATFSTKQWPLALATEWITQCPHPVVLLGGKAEQALATALMTGLSPERRNRVLNAVGSCSLHESAALMTLCQAVVTNDTGLMHIAAALQLPTVVVWGNTVPALGMYPFGNRFESVEVTGLACRPCSHLGYHVCPKGHFRCMLGNTPERISTALERILQPAKADRPAQTGDV